MSDGRTFCLTEEEWTKARKWMKEVDPPSEDPNAMRHGTIGGAFSFEFTPTAVGLIAKVIFRPTKGEERTLDLTDYGSW